MSLYFYLWSLPRWPGVQTIRYIVNNRKLRKHYYYYVRLTSSKNRETDLCSDECDLAGEIDDKLWHWWKGTFCVITDITTGALQFKIIQFNGAALLA